jgi:hypothetical protein
VPSYKKPDMAATFGTLPRLTAIARSLRPISPSTRRNMSLVLYSGWSPNGAKASITLEELKAAYGLDYKCVLILLSLRVERERAKKGVILMTMHNAQAI